MKPISQLYPSPDFFAFAETLILELITEGRYGTSQAYSKAVSSLRTFLLDQRGQDTGAQSVVSARPGQPQETVPSLPTEDIDDDLIRRYNRHLSGRGVIRNSVSFYNRTLRAIYNKAVRRLRIPDRHPFGDAYTGVDRTRSRAVGESTIARLITLDLSHDKSLEQTRDLFVFSYLMRGISFVDMAYLTKDNLRDGYIVYSRKKTGARMKVKVEERTERLLRKFIREDSGYLLPILQDIRTWDESMVYRRYQARLSVYNRKLKELSQLLREKTPLTSYVSRHSWATAARNSDIPMAVISEGLGHSSERMTRIYLDSLDGRLIDRANRKLMGRINKIVSQRETNRGQRYA